MTYKTFHRKLKIEQDELHSGRVSSSCSTCDTRRVTNNLNRDKPQSHNAVPFVLSVLRIEASYYPVSIFLLPCQYLFITPLVSSYYPVSIFLLPRQYLLITQLVSSYYPISIFLLPHQYLLITPLVSSNFSYQRKLQCSGKSKETCYSYFISSFFLAKIIWNKP